MNRYISVIVVAAYVAVAARLMPAAEPEPIPSDAIKALVGRIDQIIADKGTTSAQKTASREAAVDDFCTKYIGQTFSLRYDIKNVIKMRTVVYSEKARLSEVAPSHVIAKASDSGALYAVRISNPNSTMMLFTTPPYGWRLPWGVPEKSILSIDKSKDRLVVTATLAGKQSRISDSNVVVGLGHVRARRSSVLVSLLVKNVTVKVVSGDDAKGKPESEAAKP